MKGPIKTLNLPESLEVSILEIETTKVLIFSSQNHSKYVTVPIFVDLDKDKNKLFLRVNVENSKTFFILNQFYNSLLKYLNSFEKPFKKRLILKGLGFRIGLSEDLNSLELKLGYSHLFKISIPREFIDVKIDKNYLNIEGFDKIKVGNFANQIRNLKYPDSYKGKGFWYKDEIRVLKEIKKT